MKKINQILKSINFPKFYSKTTEGFIFNSKEKYTDIDLLTLLSNLPNKESDLSEDSVKFIIEYIEYLQCIFGKDVADKYLMKLYDNRELFSDNYPFTDKIVKTFTRRVLKYVDIPSKEKKRIIKEKYAKNNISLDTKKDLEKNLHATKLVESLSNMMLQTLEVFDKTLKEKSEFGESKEALLEKAKKCKKDLKVLKKKIKNFKK